MTLPLRLVPSISRNGRLRAARVVAFALLLLTSSHAQAWAATAINMAWNPSAGASGYIIQYGTMPGVYTVSVNVGNQTSWTFTPPVLNQTYYFVVKAYNSAGQSSASNQAGAWVGATWRTPTLQRMGDFDGDGRADPMVFRNTSGEWFARQSTGGVSYSQWGSPSLGDVPVPSDYDGDGKTDFAVYRSTTGVWFVNRSRDGALTVNWGSAAQQDIPVPADFDGDGRVDIAVFRRATGQWFILQSATNTARQVSWGSAGNNDIPVPADYNGNGKADVVVYRRSTGQWFALWDNNTATSWSWGGPALGDVPVPADYDGDGAVDYGVFRLNNATWIVHLSATNGSKTLSWGSPAAGDIPVPADYDGDDKADIAVYRASTATWYISYATGAWTSISWGSAGMQDTVGGMQEVAVVAIE